MSDALRQLVDLVESLRAARAQVRTLALNEAPSAPPVARQRHKLEWQDGRLASQGKPLDLESARQKLLEIVLAYTREQRPNRYLLIPAPPGIGKTYALVETARQLARLGERCLVLMPAHAHYQTLAEFPHFEPENFYHWRAYSAPDPECPSEKMCKFADTMDAWVNKGYHAKDLCRALCEPSGYLHICPYRAQARITENNIAAVHEHLVFGLAADQIKTVIVDEMPLRAFLRPRLIPVDGLKLENAGPIGALTQQLHALACGLSGSSTLSGKALFDAVGPLFGDALAQFETVENAKLALPYVTKPDDVAHAPWFFVEDLLKLGIGEYEAWSRDRRAWLERLSLSRAGLTLLKRGQAWAKLPARLVIMDATGEEIYEQLFQKRIEVVHLPVARQGRVFQVTHRLNGKSTLYTRDAAHQVKPLPNLLELLRLCQALQITRGYRRVGVVTFKDLVPFFEQHFGAGRVLHFGGQRGRNDLTGCDAVFVVGTPQPNDADVLTQAITLFPERQEPFALLDKDGQQIPARSEQRVTYEFVNDAGLQACRVVSGYWHDPALAAVARVTREQELHQALHRGRPLDHDCDTWVFSSVPTRERLDGVYDLPDTLLRCPPEVSWQTWTQLIVYLHTHPRETLSYDAEKYAGTVSVSAVTGLAEKRARNDKIIPLLLAAFPDVFEAVTLQGAGRPAQGLKLRPFQGGLIPQVP